MKKLLPILLVVPLALSSCSSGLPKAGDNCNYVAGQIYYEITENANGDEMYCSENNVWRNVDKQDFLNYAPSPIIAIPPPIVPKAGDRCLSGITENAFGDEMYCSEYGFWRQSD